MIYILLEEVGQFDEIPPALLGCDESPCLLECLPCYRYCNIDIFFGGFVNGCDGLLGGGIDGLEGLAVNAFDEFVVDESDVGFLARQFWSGGAEDEDAGYW